MSVATSTLEWLEGSAAAEALNPIIEARGWTPLNGCDNPCLTRARVSRDAEGEVQAFFVLQLFPMLGPVLVMHGSDPTVFRDLVADMRKFLADSKARGWLIVAEDRRIADLCRELGFVQETKPVFWGK